MKLILTLAVALLMPQFALADCDAGTLVQQITDSDKISSKGQKLTDAASILQQDRFNVNSGTLLGLYDVPDMAYVTKSARLALNAEAQKMLSPADSAAILASDGDAIVTINFDACLDSEPKVQSLAVSPLGPMPNGDIGYALNLFPVNGPIGFMREAEILSALSENNTEVLPEEESDTSVAFIGDLDMYVVGLPTSLYCGSLGCEYLLFDRFGKKLADFYAAPSDIYIHKDRALRSSDLVAFDGKGEVFTFNIVKGN